MTYPAILFVCLGNICRSPLAEGALRAEAERMGIPLTVDSAGTGDWHIGQPPDRRAIRTAMGHGVDITGLRARQVCVADFSRFTHILALDHANLGDLENIAPASHLARLSLLLDWVAGREGQAVADPYHGGEADFERTWADVSAAASAVIARLVR